VKNSAAVRAALLCEAGIRHVLFLIVFLLATSFPIPNVIILASHSCARHNHFISFSSIHLLSNTDHVRVVTFGLSKFALD